MLGIFDSGFGGLTVLRGLREALPQHAMMYLGDSARSPYGNRKREVITHYTQQCCSFLFDQGCTLIILACNTASAGTLRILQRDWLPTLRSPDTPRNILGVIRPVVEDAVLRMKKGRIAVVGTRATVASGAYMEEILKLRPEASIFQQACPLLVPLVEEGWAGKPEVRKIIRSYLRPVKERNPDVLILGCTHYHILREIFQKMVGKRCTVLDTTSIVAAKTAEYLMRHPEYDRTIERNGKTLFLTTGDPDWFAEHGSSFYGQRIPHVERVELAGPIE